MTEDYRSPVSPDTEALNDQIAALRARRDEQGWRITKADTAPVETVVGCDDHGNRFHWYLLESPGDKKGQFVAEGWVHFEKHVVI